MKQKIMNLLLVLMVGVTMFGARPAYAQEEPPIDLSLDRNGNQISDAVETEVTTLQALPADQQRAEIEHFVSKLPISADTLALQERAQELSMSLSTAKPEETQAILEELTKISSELDEDPVIKKVESDLVSLTGYGIQDSTTPSPSSAAFNLLQKGDILARQSWFGFLFPWAMKYEHLGNFNGNSQVFETYPDLFGLFAPGARLHPLSEWQTKGTYIGLGHNKRVNPSQITWAVNWAMGKYGTDGRTPYNWDFANKQTDASLYCSQLTWKIHKMAGYDLDSNAWEYQLYVSIKWGWQVMVITIPAAAPDEVMLSPYINVYSKGWN
ncbi:MAG TPA: hypothetical protein VK206_17005 [Anaerolineales bacterium]|nr:hypothetical protein [Anaerolineales bacterium]